jgi:hypothetical protein
MRLALDAQAESQPQRGLQLARVHRLCIDGVLDATGHRIDRLGEPS